MCSWLQFTRGQVRLVLGFQGQAGAIQDYDFLCGTGSAARADQGIQCEGWARAPAASAAPGANSPAGGA